MRRYNRGMRSGLSRLRFVLALLALLFHAASPVVSHAMFAGSGKSLVEICTAEGFKTIEISEPGKSTPSLKHYPHCSDCLGLGATALDLPRNEINIPSPTAHGSIRLSDGVFVFASAIRLHAPPRGPPLLNA